MEAERFNTVTAVIGRRGTGKTLFAVGSDNTSKEADRALNLPGIVDIYTKLKKQKVLIIDTFDHPAWRKFPIMPIELLKTKVWASGAYRILTVPDGIPKLMRFLNSNENIINLACIFEDGGKHTTGAISKPLKEFLGDTKQKNIDVFWMAWAWGQLPPDLFRFIDYIEVFKTNDSPEVRAAYMPGYYDQAIQVYNEVKNHKSPFYHKTIETGNS